MSRIKLYDPVTSGTLFVNSIASWKRTNEFSSSWVDDDHTKLYLCADVSIVDTDPLFKDDTPIVDKAFMLKENDDLKDFVKVIFAKNVVLDEKVKSYELLQLVPISNIEYCQLTLKKEKKSGGKRVSHKQTTTTKMG